MAGLLDMIDVPKDSFLGMLNLPASQGFGDVPKDKDADAKAMWEKLQAETDRQNAEADRRNAAGLGASSAIAPSAPSFGAPDASSPAIAMALGQPPATPFGSLAPTAPPAATPPVAQAPVPLPQPRPVIPSAVPAVAPQTDQAALPPNAQPTQGQGAPAVVEPQEPSLLSKIGDKINQNSNLLIGMGAGFAGAPSIGTGISRGLTGASAGSQLDIKQAMQQGAIGPTYKALVSAGVPPQQALAAVYNPTILKSVTENYLGDRKGELKEIYNNPATGEKKYGIFDPFTKKLTDLQGQPIGSGSPAGDAATAATPNYDPTTHRDEDFLKTLDPVTQTAVKDIADGKMPGTGRNLQKLMPYVSRYENGFDNTTYQARQKIQNSYFGGGEGDKALRSANTTIDHGMKLNKAIDDLGNYSALPAVLNPITGKIAEQAGDKKYQDSLARFDAIAGGYAKELEFALTGKNTVSGTNHIQEMFDSYGSPVKNKASMQQTLEMLQQRINEHENTYNKDMNHKGAAPFDMLTKRADLEKMLGQDTGSGLKSEAAPAAAPAAIPSATGPNGHKIVVQNGRWVDAQTGQPVQ